FTMIDCISSRRLLFIGACLGIISACVQQVGNNITATQQPGVLLNNAAIFKDRAYKAREPGTVRWLEDGSGYTALETVDAFKNVELALDELGEDINPYREIVFYDPATLNRTVLFS